MIKTLVSLSFSLMMLLACSVASSVVVTPTPTLTPPPAATLTRPPAATATLTPPPSDTPLPTPSPTDTPLPTPSPTDAPTPTTYPPVFDPAALGDNRQLASFILTRNDKTTGGEVYGSNVTIGYIKEPFSAYHLETTPRGHPNEYYLIGGRLYDKYFTDKSYVVLLEPDPNEIDYLLQNAADMRWYLSAFRPISAQFAGQEDFQGIPANHFTFDQTNLSAPTDPTGTYKIVKAQGDLYLAQDGNYLLRYHIKLTGNVYPGSGPGYSSGESEFTEELSSINQLTEITLPAEYLALKLELDLGLPVPSGTRLHLINAGTSAGTYGVQYDYFMPVTVSPADFLEFYRNLAPTNGWTVSQVGGITNNAFCQSRDCVTLKKGNAHVFLATSTQCASNMPANDTCFDGIYYR
jgi:hypothetical protein